MVLPSLVSICESIENVHVADVLIEELEQQGLKESDRSIFSGHRDIWKSVRAVAESPNSWCRDIPIEQKIVEYGLPAICL